ncbi:unnamed protein product, partial [marine sediment metagenome]
TPKEVKTYSVSVNGLEGSFKAIEAPAPAWAASEIRITNSSIPSRETKLKLCSIDVTNQQQVSAHCKLALYGRRKITTKNWSSWREEASCDGWISKVYEEQLQICHTLVMLEAVLNPGETKTFSDVAWVGIHSPDWGYAQVKFIGPFGEVVSDVFPLTVF